MPDPLLPNGTKRCKCTACGEYFTTPGTFDRHWSSGKRGRGQMTTTCNEPASLGLVKRGAYWGWPGEKPLEIRGDSGERDDEGAIAVMEPERQVALL